MPNTGRDQITEEVNVFYDKTLLVRAVPNFVHTRWAQVKDLPQNDGTGTIRFRRYGNLSAATTPLTEGVTPTGSQLSITNVDADTEYYGDFVTFTDKVLTETVDPVLTETATILGDQAGDTLDQLTRDVLNAGTTIQRVNSRALRANIVSGDIIDVATLRKALRTLKNNKARKVTSQIDPSTGVNTTPLDACYVGIIHPNVSYTLKTLTGFIPVEKYPNKSGVMQGEIGSLEEIRFIETTNAKVFAGEGSGGIDVYSILILGMHAYGISRIAGKALENIVKPLGSGGTSDPLNQRQTSGWKANFVAKILNNDFMIRVECSAAA